MMGRGLSPLQKDILKALAEEPRHTRNSSGSMTTGELSRRCHRRRSEEATSRALRRLRERGLVLGRGGLYRLNTDLTVTETKNLSVKTGLNH
jgi:DNA-binding Lrp family transcriptional regulator